MKYDELFNMIANKNNKIFRDVVSMKGDVENVKYSLRSEKGKVLLYVLSSDMAEYMSGWGTNTAVVEGEKQSFSLEQITQLFKALSKRYFEQEVK